MRRAHGVCGALTANVARATASADTYLGMWRAHIVCDGQESAPPETAELATGRCYQSPALRRRGSLSEPAGRCASRQVTPSDPTTAS